MSSGIGRVAAGQQTLPVAALLRVLQPGHGRSGLLANDISEQLERRQEREAQNDATLAAAGNSPDSATRQLAQAEREMAPGSSAFRRAQWRAAAQQRSEQRAGGDFQRVLTQASERPPQSAGSPTGTASSGQPPTETEALSTRASKPEAAAQGPSRPSVDPPASPSANAARASTLVALRPVGAGANPTSRDTASSMRPGGVQAVGKAAAAPGAQQALAGRAAAAGRGGSPAQPLAGADGARNAIDAAKAAVRKRATSQQPASNEGKTDANVERVLRLIHHRLGKERSVATLRLDPPELGTIKLRMDLRNEHLRLRVETQSPEARHLLTQQLDALRHGLESAGIRLDQFELRLMEATAGGETQPDSPQGFDVDPGEQEASARSDARSAGGGGEEGTESESTPVALESADDVMQVPLMESRVNVLA